MHSSRQEYIKAMKRDVDRIRSEPISGFSGDVSGVTITNTINGVTTSHQVSAQNYGTISSSIGCINFKDIKDKDNTSSTAKVLGRFGVVCIEGMNANNEPFTFESSSDSKGNVETKSTGEVAITTTVNIDSAPDQEESTSPRFTK